MKDKIVHGGYESCKQHFVLESRLFYERWTIGSLSYKFGSALFNCNII